MAHSPGGNLRFWLKGYLFLGVAVLILAMLLYSNHLISRMRLNADYGFNAVKFERALQDLLAQLGPAQSTAQQAA